MSTETITTLTLAISAPTAAYQDKLLSGDLRLRAANRDEALAALATLRSLALLAAVKGELVLSAQADRMGADPIWTTYGLRTDTTDLIGRWLDEVVTPLIDHEFAPAAPADSKPAAPADHDKAAEVPEQLRDRARKEAGLWEAAQVELTVTSRGQVYRLAYDQADVKLGMTPGCCAQTPDKLELELTGTRTTTTPGTSPAGAQQ